MINDDNMVIVYHCEGMMTFFDVDVCRFDPRGKLFGRFGLAVSDPLSVEFSSVFFCS